MSTKIILRELSLSCSIGIDEAERHVRQKVLLDADITLVDGGAANDNAAAYDYHRAVLKLRDLAQARHYGLLETFAEHVAAALLDEAAAAQVRVYCRKPRVFDDIASAGVEIVRGK